MMYDLHTHSTASDGTMTPAELLDFACDLGLGGVAITDHDTVQGIAPAREHLQGKNLPLEFIPGIEINTEWHNSEVHILGYFIEPTHEQFNRKLREIKEARWERAVKMVNKLRGMGLTISLEKVKELAQGDLVGRPHIAQALIEKGYVFSVKEAFVKYIGRQRPAYIPRYKIIPVEAIDLIRLAGGIPVLAHPGLLSDVNIMHELLDIGIAGLEVYYPEHTMEQTNLFRDFAIENNLLITGGSDNHGKNSDSTNRMGCNGINQELMQKIYDFHNSQPGYSPLE